jgi:transcriptional regulator with XRE-family HTH domain
MSISNTPDSRHCVQRCQQLFRGIVDGVSTRAVLLLDLPPTMPYKALAQLRMNVDYLLLSRRRTRADLAAEMKIDPSTLTKFFNGTREIQFHHLDGMAGFFGLDTYELFRPGISPLTERRKIKDRRMGLDRRRVDRLAHVPAPHPPQTKRMDARSTKPKRGDAA